MKLNIKKSILFALISALLILPDQWTKQLAVQYLSDGTSIPLIPDILYLLYVENRGAAFGILYGRQWIFYIITIVVLFSILYIVGRTPADRRYRPLLLVSGLIFGGALGNFIDRVRQAYVVDFIYFRPIDFPVFNVADIFVTVGCFALVLLFLFYYKDDDFDFVKRRKDDH